MSFFQRYAKKILGSSRYQMTPERASKWMGISRMLYFASAATMLILVIRAQRKFEEKKAAEETQRALESGKPVIKDHSEDHKRIRLGGHQSGVIYEWIPGKGLSKTEVNTNEYYQQLEKEAYERAKQAQEKAIAEGRELPKDAIRLV